MAKPVCVECRMEMKVLKNGIVTIYLDNNKRPYKIRNGDMWICKECDTRVLVGFGNETTGNEEFCKNYEANAKANGVYTLRVLP